jgi:eukaryotic-like serine/threonine-protein kinase
MSPQPSGPTPPSEPDATTIAAGAGSAPGFGSSRLLEKLGEGDMGEVWLAEQTAPVRRRGALKHVSEARSVRRS